MMTYRIDTRRRLVIVTGTGMLSADAISASQAELRSTAGFDPSFALLADFRDASFAEIEPNDVRRHAEQDPFGSEAPRAIVVSHGSQGMVGMFKAYSELFDHTGPVQAFADLDSALAWIESVRSAGPGPGNAG